MTTTHRVINEPDGKTIITEIDGMSSVGRYVTLTEWHNTIAPTWSNAGLVRVERNFGQGIEVWREMEDDNGIS